MKTLLVTGGCGFIGSNYIRYVLSEHAEWQIINLDKLTYAGNPENLSNLSRDSRYRFVHGDICNVDVVQPLVDEADVVINFAAETHVDRSILGGAEFVQTNISGTYTLLECARVCGVERFLQVSTDEVYGSIEEGLWTEEWPLDPRSPYSASKASAELLVRAFHVTHGVPILITRCSNNIGPYQYPEKRVPLFVTNAIDNLALPVYGNGSQIRDHLYVEDHCSAINVVLNSGELGEAYNVGSDNEATGIDVVRTILRILDKPETLIEYVSDRPGHDARYALDSSKLRELGWLPICDYEQAMQRTVEWYVSNEAWWRSIKDSGDFRDYYQRNYGKR
ncbi:MAG: dTDP-glucose 4,6-dehydratase [Candidatus Latescibacterota bacterium]|nr:dTDP-glucose 4,6-dehydratase [Candidatus Latescibacterota bacterium]